MALLFLNQLAASSDKPVLRDKGNKCRVPQAGGGSLRNLGAEHSLGTPLRRLPRTPGLFPGPHLTWLVLVLERNLQVDSNCSARTQPLTSLVKVRDRELAESAQWVRMAAPHFPTCTTAMAAAVCPGQVLPQAPPVGQRRSQRPGQECLLR